MQQEYQANSTHKLYITDPFIMNIKYKQKINTMIKNVFLPYLQHFHDDMCAFLPMLTDCAYFTKTGSDYKGR
jgi:hypothetical protein